ncbi:effector binding domain-containing protein [Brevibacillus laterosporus]|uniref:AraC family transcriptional regulator n=1 Tax=Brevibacillus laterosporus TaxID=1465 RepID=UPI00035CD029|nr:effector binding domain-containing protein [Brevibacillus laterosporus]ATO48414.1 AraC family transcriptional regulator [Brevibacillus laterosporus DSM 25]MBG9803193.1 transcriptional regulator [Brevibacillus laterosporus]MED2002121.1 effector binding domain-containing protein [Brevibacillus laterosporus]MED4765460.1 effector binding domain-containing protein [Brevibacillus laterosporus]TPH11844.1 helix-turn-helix domain-containing protein [Brevibacillus laterosporus]
MDYFERIQNSIEFIEKNLQEELNITEISSKSCFSAFHFQRIFQAITGFSVQEYIRSRRLSEAAILLKETRKNILEIAFFFQYGSQEAFTRAFVNYFGLTPAKYRKERTIIKQQQKINFLDYKNKTKGNLVMNKPEVVVLNKKLIIGYEYKTNLNNEKYFEEIPVFYIDFGRNEYYCRISKKISPNMSYGISANFDDEGHFSFIVGEEVKEINSELENGFVNFEIPEGKYARFKVNGTTDLVQSTRRYIYGTWLLNSKYERRDGPDFEITDVLNSTLPNEMKMKIYIPIK